jgi:3-methylcrotonyl-CoA carboxylase alpha subunit
VKYENAGTIEFIADASEGLRADRIWFMEMNTRLQVEHPVTEEITGQDLVEWQLRVASGEKLPKSQHELSITGHAIEARLYAEDPAKGFLPSVGKLVFFQLRGPRIETGVEEADVISPFYDPMIAKLVAHAPDRDEAISDLAGLCGIADVWPVKTNAGFLMKLLDRPEFQKGAVDTNFISANLEDLVAKPPMTEEALESAAQALVGATSGFQPWGFRLNGSAKTTMRVLIDGEPTDVAVPLEWSRYANYLARGTQQGDRFIKFDQGYAYEFSLNHARGTGTTHGHHDGEIEAPMPGRVTAVEVSAGENVVNGQRLLTLEAMKMEHALTAPFDGTVAELAVATGQQVSEGQLLAKLEPDRQVPAP